MNISENELLDALRDALRSAPPEQDGFTTQDVAVALGVSTDKARKAMKALLVSGQAVPVRLLRPDMFGRPNPVNGIQPKRAA